VLRATSETDREGEMNVKTYNYKKNVFGAYRLHDWSAPLTGTKLEDHMSEMAAEGWKMAGQVSTSKDMITVTYTKD
jgi:hypothetical protein